MYFPKRVNNSGIKKDALKIIVMIAKKCPSDLTVNNNIKDSYIDIFPSNNDYTDENRMFIYILYKEMVKEGVVKKGEYGVEIIKKILFIGKITNINEDITSIEKDIINIINDYLKNAKEEGFESEIWNDKNKITPENIFCKWKELCMEKVCIFNFNYYIILYYF